MLLPKGTWKPWRSAAVPPRCPKDRPLSLLRSSDGAVAMPYRDRGVWRYALVSRTDGKWACARNWFTTHDGYIRSNKPKHHGTVEYLHVLVTLRVGIWALGMSYDHVNRRTWDCRRTNLRALDQSNQNRNQERSGESAGVTWEAERHKYAVAVSHQGQRHWGGYHSQLKTALAARDRIRASLSIEPLRRRSRLERTQAAPSESVA